MKTSTLRAVAVGLLVFAVGCSEQPVAPDPVLIPGTTLDAKPGSATEALLNDKLNEIFEPGERSVPNSTLAGLKDCATQKPNPDWPCAFAAAFDLLVQAADEIDPNDPLDDDLLEEFAELITRYFNELGGVGTLCAIFPAGGDCITENADAGVNIPSTALAAPALITITRRELAAGERCLDTDNPQSPVDCWTFTSTEPFQDSVLVGQCINTDWVKSSQVPLIRLGGQDGNVVATLPANYAPGDLDFLTGCTPIMISAAEPNGLFQYAQQGWQQLKSGLTSLFGPIPLQADAIAVLATGGIGGKKGSFSDFGPMLPSEMSIHQGDGQTGGIGTEAPVDPAVLVTDVEGGLVEGASIHFQVLLGGGSVTPMTVYSTAAGIAKVDSWILGNPGANVLEAKGAGIGDPGDAGPLVDDGVAVTHDTGRVQFNAEAILPGGGELVVINDVDVFDNAGAANDGNAKLIDNLVAFFNADRGLGTTIWYDRGRSSKCADFTGCTDTDLTTMLGIVETDGRMVNNNNSGSGDRYGTIPAGVKVIFLWNPTTSFQKQEVNALKTFMSEGGRVVLVGENKDFVGANGITAANRLLKDLKVAMRVNSDNVACPGPTVTTTNGASLIMTGVGVVGGITIDCASSMTMEGEELFSSGGSWVGGVAIDLYQ
jgi:hypothetical protein